MNPLLMLFIMAVIGGVLALIGSAVNKGRDSKPKYRKMLDDFQQEVTAQLEPDEKLEAHCGYNPCVAVTTKHIFIQTKQGIDKIPLGYIAKAEGMSYNGQKTTYPHSMQSVTLKQVGKGKKYTFYNRSEGFIDVATEIDRKIGF